MSIPIECACGKLLRVPDESAGKQVKCSSCFQILTVPGGSGAPSVLVREPGNGGQRAIPKTKIEQPADTTLSPPLPIHPRTMLVQSGDMAFQDEPQPAPVRHGPAQDVPPPMPLPRRSRLDKARDLDEVEPISRRREPAGGKSAMVVALVAAFGLLFLGGSAGLIWWVVNSEDKPIVVPPNPPPPLSYSKDKEGKDKEGKDKEGKDKGGNPPVSVPVAKRTPEQIYRRLLRSTTWIVGENGSSGSGVLIDTKERLVLTNHHIIEGSSSPVVYFPAFAKQELKTSSRHYLENSRKLGIAARVVHEDRGRDLAVLQLIALPTGVSAVPLASQSVSPRAGILAIGNAGVEKDEMWQSIPGQVQEVSAQSHSFEGKTSKVFVLKTSAATTFGDSGGPVAGESGLLVGLVIGSSVKDQLVTSLIDIREIRPVVDACYRKEYKKDWQDANPAEVVDLKSLPKLLDQLKSPDNKVRAESIRSLGDLGPDARTAVPVLFTLHKNGDPSVNQQILAALEMIGPPESTEAGKLVEKLDDGKPDMRLYAIRSLAQIGPAEAKGLLGLKKACDDSDPEVRFAALRAFTQLSEEDSREVHPLAIALLKDEAVRTRQLAANVLQSYGKNARSEVLVPLIAALADKSIVLAVQKALLAISPMTVDDIPVLRKEMKNPNGDVRLFAALSLQFLEAKALPALEELLSALDDKDLRVCRAAIGAIGKFGAAGAQGIPRLLATLEHADKGLRVAAVEALGGIGRQAGVFPALFTALKDPEVEVRATAASALKRLGKPDKADIEGISKFLTDPLPLLRSQAAETLGRLGADAKGSIKALTGMVGEDKSLRARLAAVGALAEIGPEAREASETLAKALGDKIAPTDEDLSDLFEKSSPKPVGGEADPVHKALLRSTVVVGMLQRFGGTAFSTGWVVDTSNRLIVTTSRNLAGASGRVLVCFPDIEKGEVHSQFRHYQENDNRLAILARVVHSDLKRELMIVQLVGRMPALALPLRIAGTGAVAGQSIHAMGAVDVNAGRGEGTLWIHTSAKVRQIDTRTVGFGLRSTDARFIEADTRLKCNDSGGPVVNDQLQLVGMVSGKRDGFSNRSLCMDLSEIKVFLADYAKLAKIDSGSAGGGAVRQASARVNQAVFRCVVAAALEKIGTDVPDKVVPALVKALADDSDEVQAATVAAIGSLGPKAKAAFLPLMKMLPKGVQDSPVEEAIVKMGGEVAPKVAHPISFTLKLSAKEEVLTACRILRKMGKEGATAVPVLKKNLQPTQKFWMRHQDVLEAIKLALESLEGGK